MQIVAGEPVVAVAVLSTDGSNVDVLEAARKGLGLGDPV